MKYIINIPQALKKGKAIIVLLAFAFLFEPAFAVKVQIKNLAKPAGQRENQLVGYGVVVGLPQSGDSRGALAKQSMAAVLRNSGLNVDEEVLAGKNIAAVLVMANLPGAVKEGDKIDIWVSSIGDAKSIAGGYLLQTPLNAGDGVTYAVAQSMVASGKQLGVTMRGSQNKNTMYVSQGAVVERAPLQPLIGEDENSFVLKMIHFDLATAGAIANAINSIYEGSASLNQDGTINIAIPDGEEPYGFLNAVYSIEVEAPDKPRLVIDQSTATIVMGHNVSISSVGIAKDGIMVKVRGEQSNAQAPKTGSTGKLGEAATAEELVDALNHLGLSAADIIDIIKAINAVGALHGELILL